MDSQELIDLLKEEQRKAGMPREVTFDQVTNYHGGPPEVIDVRFVVTTGKPVIEIQFRK